MTDLVSRLERYDEAERCLPRRYEGLCDAPGAEHKETLRALERLIGLYAAWGKPEKTEEYRLLLETAEKTQKAI